MSNRKVFYCTDESCETTDDTQFKSMVDSYQRSIRAKTPLASDLECFQCGTNPSRMNADLQMGMCDGCYEVQRVHWKAIDANYRPPMDQVPEEVIPGQLFIGSKEAAANPATLAARNIKRVIVCCTTIPMYFPEDSDVKYIRLAMNDSLDQNLLAYLPHAFDFIDEGIRCGEATLVHCNAGVSRSGAVVVGYLMKSKGLSFEDALTEAKSKRSKITPNSNFVEQLKLL